MLPHPFGLRILAVSIFFLLLVLLVAGEAGGVRLAATGRAGCPVMPWQ